MSGNALASSDKNDLLCQKLRSVIRAWPAKAGECKPSTVCGLVAESGVASYSDCANQVAILLQQGELKIEPQQRGLYVP